MQEDIPGRASALPNEFNADLVTPVAITLISTQLYNDVTLAELKNKDRHLI